MRLSDDSQPDKLRGTVRSGDGRLLVEPKYRTLPQPPSYPSPIILLNIKTSCFVKNTPFPKTPSSWPPFALTVAIIAPLQRVDKLPDLSPFPLALVVCPEYSLDTY